MAVLRRPFDRARRLAREMLWECGVDEPSKIDPFLIVGRRRILVTYSRLDGPTAQILRCGDRAIIRVSDQIVQIGRLRFTIAHEVAHFLLGHQIPSEADLAAGSTAPFTVQQEREANVFAAEFLMPEEWVAPLCTAPPTLASVHAIAQAFGVTSVAAAVRYVELTREPCAVVYSKHGRVEWSSCSPTFPRRIPEQMTIGPGAVASDYHTHRVLEAEAREVAASAWFARHMSAGCDSLVEHAELVPEPGWGGVLSLLSGTKCS
jgi:Zn-dependent peptidase ImmA (M78 family)